MYKTFVTLLNIPNLVLLRFTLLHIWCITGAANAWSLRYFGWRRNWCWIISCGASIFCFRNTTQTSIFFHLLSVEIHTHIYIHTAMKNLYLSFHSISNFPQPQWTMTWFMIWEFFWSLREAIDNYGGYPTWICEFTDI